ncbi:MAG: putative rane protein [Bryobacterales bacterium]|nr:putative rane protein [Bryobacterales bacterium]
MLVCVLIAIQNPLNESELVFPILECFHIVGFAVTVGTIALVDFRLLGFGLRQNGAELSKILAPWTLFGLASLLLSGPMLFSSDPDMYYLNSAFQIKMVLLALAIGFHYTIRRKLLRGELSPGLNKPVACISLALWTGIVFAAIFIAFIVTPGH